MCCEFLSPSSRQLQFRLEEINGLRHDRLKDEFTGAHVTHKMLEAKKVKILGTANDDVTVGG